MGRQIEYYKDATLNMVKHHSHALTFYIFVVILSEEMRGETTQDACMCEAQIVFQKKVQSTIQELSRKHILLLGGLRRILNLL